MRSFAKALVILAVASTASSAQQINLLPGGGSVGSWGSFGGGAGADWGQSFTTPTGYNQLDQFTFFFKGNGAGLPFRAYVATFNGATNTAGTMLFQSAITMGVNSATLAPFVFNTGGIAVTAGTKYFAFVDASDYVASGGAAKSMGGEYADFGAGYAGGDFLYNNGINGTFTNTQTTGWTPKGDLVFNATFSSSAVVATPEPATLGLLATGLIGVVGVARRKRAA